MPMPAPPPVPPSPLLAVPLGDMASAPAPVEFGSPGFVPGWLDTMTAEPAAFPPAFAGGATEEPRSNGSPAPVPWLPRPLPERVLPPPSPGGGGTTLAEPGSELAVRPPLPEELCAPMLAGGGTTCGVSAAARDRESEPPSDPTPDAVGGGGTGLARKSPRLEFPQLLRSRLTCDGGGAMTAGAGSVGLAADGASRCGAETGGAITSTVCASGMRELASSRCVSRGAGAMTVCSTIMGASGLAVRILSRWTFGAGGTTAALKLGEGRVVA